MIFKLIQKPRTSGISDWVRQRDGSWRCGNVKVAIDPKAGRDWDSWFVYVLRRTRWVKCMPPSRPWGYGHSGQAKIGAALMARHRKKRRRR